jgi:hypothetical protein
VQPVNNDGIGFGVNRMAVIFPFHTSYDPPGTSEGTLDPLGLYQIAEQLAVQLVPAVRERMQRIRFLTAMAVGSLVTEGLHDNREFRDASPYLVWEWLVVEAFDTNQRRRSRDLGNTREFWLRGARSISTATWIPEVI